MKAVPYREFSYAGLVMWSLVLFLFAYLQVSRRYLLKKPIKIPADIGLNRKEEYLAPQRAVWANTLAVLRGAGYLIQFGLAGSCLATLIIAATGLLGCKQIALFSFTVAALVVPAFLAELLGVSLTKDILRRFEENDCVLQAAPRAAGPGKAWLLNLVPLMALVFFYQGRAELLNQLGFGTAMALVVVILSVIFLLQQQSVGVCVNFILLGFVFTSYLAPGFDLDQFRYLGPAFLMAGPILPLLAISYGAIFLVRYPIKTPQGNCCRQLPEILSVFSRWPVFMAFVAPMAAYFLQKYQLISYSLTIVSLQSLGWLAVLLSFSLLERRGKLDCAGIRDYIKKEKKYRLPFDRTFLWLVLPGLFILSAALETYRGLWLFFGGTVLWLSLMCLCLWKVWKYAFPE